MFAKLPEPSSVPVKSKKVKKTKKKRIRFIPDEVRELLERKDLDSDSSDDEEAKRKRAKRAMINHTESQAHPDGSGLLAALPQPTVTVRRVQ